MHMIQVHVYVENNPSTPISHHLVMTFFLQFSSSSRFVRKKDLKYLKLGKMTLRAFAPLIRSEFSPLVTFDNRGQ